MKPDAWKQRRSAEAQRRKATKGGAAQEQEQKGAKGGARVEHGVQTGVGAAKGGPAAQTSPASLGGASAAGVASKDEQGYSYSRGSGRGRGRRGGAGGRSAHRGKQAGRKRAFPLSSSCIMNAVCPSILGVMTLSVPPPPTLLTTHPWPSCFKIPARRHGRFWAASSVEQSRPVRRGKPRVGQ